MATKAIPTYLPNCLVGELTSEFLEGLILGTPQVGKGARNILLGLYGIKEREESNKDPGENVSGKERIRERISIKSKKISNDQELIQSDPISCPQNQKGNN